MKSPAAPTVRSVNAALRAAGISIYKRSAATRDHRGNVVQSNVSGARVQSWSDVTVRVIPEVHGSSFAPAEQRTRNLHRAYAKTVAALAGFTCHVDTRSGGIIVSVGR